MTTAAMPTLVLELGEKGGHLEFEQPSELQQWLDEENSKWHWMSQIHEVHSAPGQFAQLRQVVARYIQQWTQQQSDLVIVQQSIDTLKSQLESGIQSQSLWLSSSPVGSFLLKLKAERHQLVAAGAYLALGGAYSPQSHQAIHPLFMEGIIEGFLYKREIDWTATAHREILEKLELQYAKNLSEQQNSFQQMEHKNDTLNSQFGDLLSAQSKLFEELNLRQSDEFDKLVKAHEANLKVIEDTFEQKLALMKPVEYWDDRGKAHAKKAKTFAWASAVIGVLVLFALGWLAYETFFTIPSDGKPQVWQVGVFSIGAFFGIWLVRMLVRMFVSNLHLATDADERVTMLQTYLSIIREGSEFAPEDKQLILARLFHPATDGMVKDDAAPPSPLEILSRGR